MDNLNFILYSIVYMTDDSIWSLHIFDCESTSLPIMLEESKETIFQMKDAMHFSFKELQLNMDN